jgi:hypothetical protein
LQGVLAVNTGMFKFVVIAADIYDGYVVVGGGVIWYLKM